MGRQKQDAKTFILPHTKAKLDLYEIYLRVADLITSRF